MPAVTTNSVKAALSLVDQSEKLKPKLKQLIGIPEIVETSARQLLGELAALDPKMTARQWVAHSGLEPAHQICGSSVYKHSRISRHGKRYLRLALYMPALVGVRFDPHLKAFYLHLQARRKTKLQALIAVSANYYMASLGSSRTVHPTMEQSSSLLSKQLKAKLSRRKTSVSQLAVD